MNDLIYLHGFASGPQSAKAQFFKGCFQQVHCSLQIPDLNQADFYHLTLTRQLRQVAALLPPDETPVTLIGSSFGGLTAAWLGEQFAQIQRLVLLAPAFQFLNFWQPRLGVAQMQQWQQTGELQVYHYAAQQMLPLSYQFLTDLNQYDESRLQRELPTLILHGLQDEVIPIQASRNYAATRPWVKLIELDSDHALTHVESELWQAVAAFCGLTSG
jgi:uncharacterized protein